MFGGTAWFFSLLICFCYQYLSHSNNVIFALSAKHQLLVWKFCILVSTKWNGFPHVQPGSAHIFCLCHLEESNCLLSSLAEYHSCCCFLLAERAPEEVLNIFFTLCFWCIHRNKPIFSFLCWENWHFYSKQESAFAFSGCRIGRDKVCNMNLQESILWVKKNQWP